MRYFCLPCPFSLERMRSLNTVTLHHNVRKLPRYGLNLSCVQWLSVIGDILDSFYLELKSSPYLIFRSLTMQSVFNKWQCTYQMKKLTGDQWKYLTTCHGPHSVGGPLQKDFCICKNLFVRVVRNVTVSNMNNLNYGWLFYSFLLSYVSNFVLFVSKIATTWRMVHRQLPGTRQLMGWLTLTAYASPNWKCRSTMSSDNILSSNRLRTNSVTGWSVE
jgi:hypothetical protein